MFLSFLLTSPPEIAKWRTGGNSITLRQHEVHKVYTCNDLGDDVLMTGTLTLGSSSGLTAEGPYCARCVVDDASSPSPKIKHWQGWVVSCWPTWHMRYMLMCYFKDNTPFADLGIQRTPVTRTMNGILDTIGGR